MKRILFIFGGCLAVILLSLAFTAWAYFLVCLGLHPESVESAGLWVPLLAIFCTGAGAGAASRGSRKAWTAGLYPAVAIVAIWVAVWFYVVGRFSPADWWHEGIGKIGPSHLAEWLAAIFLGLAGSIWGSRRKGKLRGVILNSLALSLVVLTGAQLGNSRLWSAPEKVADGMEIVTSAPDAEGTVVRLFTFDFAVNPGLRLRLYDADMDDRAPYDDANSSYMGQGIDLVGKKLNRATHEQGAQLLCAFNSGFFGARDHRIAFHEAPVAIDGSPHYNVDLIRPKDQAWVFAVASTEQIHSGSPRFRLVPEIPWEDLSAYSTVLAGVRPLRVEGASLELKPGIGSTKLRCSRTSIGWNSAGDKFYALIVRDPDTEAASNLQRRGGRTQTGGWDLRELQAFWEKHDVPNAVLLDGGESTQVVYRNRAGILVFLRAGYHVGLPLGHLWSRPLLAFPAMLPRLQNSRGVLNYLYVDLKKE